MIASPAVSSPSEQNKMVDYPAFTVQKKPFGCFLFVDHSTSLTIQSRVTKVDFTMNYKVFATCTSLLVTSLFVIPGISANNTSTENQDTWLKSIHLAWAEEDGEFKDSATSPLAGVSRFEINETGNVYFAVEGGQLGWSANTNDQAVFSLVNTEGGWKWTRLAEGVSLMRKEDTLPTGTLLAVGDNLQIERFTVQFYPSKDVVTALVFDPDTQRIKEFTGLDRFEANPKFALTAKVTKFESPEQLDLITGLQRFKKQYRYAKLQFEIDGTDYELTAYKHALEGAGSSSLFIPFTDKTSGKYNLQLHRSNQGKQTKHCNFGGCQEVRFPGALEVKRDSELRAKHLHICSQ
jgi:hypothetical protein